MLALGLSLELILLIGVGFLVWRLRLVDENFDASLTGLLINVALPCLIVNSFSSSLTAQQLKNCVVLVGLSLGFMALWFAVGQGIWFMCSKGYRGRLLRFGCLFCNFSFVGIPVIQALYGETGVLYFVVFTAPVRMVYYSGAKPLLSPKGATGEKGSLWQHLKGWLCAPVVAVLVGVALALSGLELPGVIKSAVSDLGSVCAPMGMILCGVSLGKHRLKELLRPQYLLMPLVRNLLIPAISLAVLMLLPVEPLVAKVVLIYAAMPVASLLAAFTIEYDPRPQVRLESAGDVFTSLALCTVSIPLWAKLADILL